jgi:hypothetical protein
MNGTLILHNQKTGSKNIMKFLLRKSYMSLSDNPYSRPWLIIFEITVALVSLVASPALREFPLRRLVAVEIESE